MHHYLKLALRSLRKNPFYSILNITGLSLGIACSIILFQFIHYQLSFDTYHKNAAQLYRVITDLHLDDGSVHNDKGAPIALATAIQSSIPQVKEQAFLFSNYRDHTFTVSIAQVGNTPKLFSEHGSIAFADKHWFSLFDYTWLAGNPNTSLEEPNTAVLSKSIAEKYFGDKDPIGQTILLEGEQEVKITGILKDNAANTDIKASIFIAASSLKKFYPEQFPDMLTSWGWINSSNSLFLLLPQNVSPQTVNNVIAVLKGKAMGDMAKYYDFHLQPLKDIHFDARYSGSISRSLLFTLGIIGFLILLVACVNFINLATAQNARRIKEISTRKILGSSAAAIFWQFIAETTCIVLLSVVFAIVWVLLALPVLNQWLQTSLVFQPLGDTQLLTALVSLIIFVVLAAGVYPAFLLTRFKPLDALKTKSGNNKQPWLRKSLIVLQNVVAQSLIICTLIITLQRNYITNADLGFSKEAIVMVSVPKPTTKNLVYLRNQLMGLPNIKDASFCFRPPASENYKAGSVKFDSREWESYSALAILGDAHYLKTFGLQLVAGRNIAESDTVREFLITEGTIKKLGYTNPSQVLGHTLVAGALNDHPGTIVGVIKDIHLHSLHKETEPLLVTTSANDYAYAGIKIKSNNAAKSIAQIKNIWQSVYPNNLFDYHFLDEQIATFYKNEDLLDKLITSFTIVAIVISSIGLLGLISLLTLQRTKEIGIRKIIGASITNIAVLLSKDFAKLVVLALLLATAVSWLVMQYWLQGFAYRIAIPWWTFLLAGLGNMLLALFTIGYHTIKAALVNPIESLRTE